MYLVVGCSECSNLWIVAAGHQSVGCSRCGKRSKIDRLRTLGRASDQQEARAIRTQLLADRDTSATARPDPASLSSVDRDGPVVSDEELFRSQGIDPAEIEAASTRTARRTTPNRNRRAAVLKAVDTMAEPTKAAIIDHLNSQGMDPEIVERVLDGLHREGSLVRDKNGYRRPG